MLSFAAFGMIRDMNKERLVKSWAALGASRPSFEEYEREINRPMRLGPYGGVDLCEVLDWISRQLSCYGYFELRHELCSRRVAKLKAAERRPKYYAAENERRRALAAERRRIRRRRTTNACPTREAVLEAWNHRKDSHEAAIRFGSLLEDLECYLDNSLLRADDGLIVGRNPGIKGYLADNLPEILEKYTTAMRYKAAAKKLKQVVELADPTPAEVVLPRGEAAAKGSGKRDYGADEIPELAVVRAQAIWAEVVGGIGLSATALMARLDALTDPERVEDANMLAAWREKYANEITVRTKRRWWRRLVKEAGERIERIKSIGKVKGGGSPGMACSGEGGRARTMRTSAA